MKNSKSRKPKLIYIMAGASTIPNEKAHSVQIMKMCEAFARMGLEVELFTPDIRIDRKLENIDPFKYYGIENRFKITRIPCLDLSSAYKYVKKSFYVQALFYAFMATLHALRRNSDIIYTRDFYTALLLTAKGKGDNLIYEIHEFPRGYIRKFLELRMVKKIHCVFISSTLKSLFEQHVHGKFLVAPDGVDISMFKGKEREGEELKKSFGIHIHGSKLVGYVGQLSARGVKKGVDDLIKSMRYVNGICVIVGGQDAEVRKYKDKIMEKGLEDKVIFNGRVPHSDIPNYLSIFDVCVLPFPQEAYTDLRFLSPLKMFEYMASKKPIVATDLPTIREILNEDNAVLVKPNDPKALAGGIRRVLEDERFARKIAETAYDDVQQYSWEKRAERILEFIGEKHV